MEETIEVKTYQAKRFVMVAEHIAGVTFDPDWDPETRFAWALGYAQSKLAFVPEEHQEADDASWSLLKDWSLPKEGEDGLDDELADEEEQ